MNSTRCPSELRLVDALRRAAADKHRPIVSRLA
jgi:hypothetical protein